MLPKALRPEQSGWFWNLTGGMLTETQWGQVRAEHRLIRYFYRLSDRMGLQVPASRTMRKNLSVAEHDPFIVIPGVAIEQTWIPPDVLEIAALAQHYGIPTRLLDWTYDLNTALYFGFRDAIGKDGNLVIWALNMEDVHFFKITGGQLNVEFVTPPYANNPNLYAQKGLFSHWPIKVQSLIQIGESGRERLVDRRPLDELIVGQLSNQPGMGINIFTRLVLPCSEAIRGYHILDNMGWNEAKLFPGYRGVAKQILSRPQLGVPPPRRERDEHG